MQHMTDKEMEFAVLKQSLEFRNKALSESLQAERSLCLQNSQQMKELTFEEIKALIADVEKDGRKSLNAKELIFLKKNIALLYKYKEFDCPWGL